MKHRGILVVGASLGFALASLLEGLREVTLGLDGYLESVREGWVSPGLAGAALGAGGTVFVVGAAFMWFVCSREDSSE